MGMELAAEDEMRNVEGRSVTRGDDGDAELR